MQSQFDRKQPLGRYLISDMMPTMKKAICIHGHYYQPPREDPVTGEVPIQPSAAPWRDWNTRINEECYRAACHSPILDGSMRVIERMNLYESMSFDVGPTLMRWLIKHAPDVYRAIQEADRTSCGRLNGAGNAMTQGYHHVILPLANQRDKQTELRWAIADFTHRFGRRPSSCWLPETAADYPTLEAMVDEGLTYVLLAPGQCEAVRPIGEETHWRPNDGVDTSIAYRIPLESGRSIDAFFYDGATSQGVAFGGWLNNGEAMAGKLMERPGRMVSLATDGESYGHHHVKGDMALAYCVRTLREQGDAEITNFEAYLAQNPPKVEAKLVAPSAWSCSHGVGRWSENCGCVIDPKMRGLQQWRRPLRDSLNALRDGLAEYYEREVRQLGESPWELRDRYVWHRLAREVAYTPLDQDPFPDPEASSGVQRLVGLLEMQRFALQMFTSCGWFFDAPTGLETTQIIRYARRAIEIADHLGAPKAASDDFERSIQRMLAEHAERVPLQCAS